VQFHLQALQEAAKHLAKSRVTDREAQMEALDARMQRIQRFCAARDMLPSDPAGAVTICQQLLQELPDQQVIRHSQNINDFNFRSYTALLHSCTCAV
jgi:hypothetical protein